MFNKESITNMPYRSPRAVKRLLAKSGWNDLTKYRQGLSSEYGDEIDILNKPLAEPAPVTDTLVFG